MSFDFDAFLSLWDKVKDLHPSLQSLHPIAIVDGEKIHLYEPHGYEYRFKKSWDKPNYIPEDIRAAFPVEENDFKITCVVGLKAVQDLEGMVFLLHEFVHCYQFNTCELELKNRLEISRYYMEKKVYDWELSHPFPYDDETVRTLYLNFVEAASSGQYSDIPDLRTKLRGVLSRIDYEYMVWEEWKEGFARYIENLIREEVGLKKYLYWGPEFNRITFYRGGEELTKYLVKLDPSIESDLVRLFEEMYNLGFS